MGLAPYGKPKYKDLIIKRLLDLKDDGSFRLNMKYFNYATGLTMTNKKFSQLHNIKPKYALKHPNWKMGKKISIDSATMMNKVFEVIEAKKLFNLNYKNISILTHPKSYVHAIVKFKNALITNSAPALLAL